MFDDFLRQHAADTHIPFQPFDIGSDYQQYVDGKPRFDGVRSFLMSRGITLPEGEPDASPQEQSVCGLGNRKNDLVNEVLATEGVVAYKGSVALVHHLRDRGIKMAVVSSSQNCEAVLKAAGLADLFDVRVDGTVADQLQLAGKPAPDTFLKAAEQLSVDPAHAVVVEDAISGVQAGRAGGFGLVIGVDRHGDAAALKQNGATIVVTDLGELLL
jgi:HAD superfamily hydrolase (TIGR01509 family)